MFRLSAAIVRRSLSTSLSRSRLPQRTLSRNSLIRAFCSSSSSSSSSQPPVPSLENSPSLLDAHDHHEHGLGCGCGHEHDHDHDHEQQLKAMKEPAMKVEGVRNADMWIVFTCTKCETRSIKGMTRHAYEKGIVIVRCGGCDVLHLIADNIGWFPEDDIHPQESKVHNIERMLSAKGEIVRRVTQDGLVSLTPEELAEIQKLATSSSAAAAGSSPSS